MKYPLTIISLISNIELSVIRESSKEKLLDQNTPNSPNKGCSLLPNQRYLSVLPGIGWDNLVNRERGPVIDVEQYTNCRTSADGNFLIPDDVIVQPLKNSEVKLTSEVYESISQCRSLTAYSINSALEGGYSFFRINGDFSFDKETLREKLSQKLGLIVQSEMRHNRYFVQQIPDPKLHSRFKNRLLDIAAYLERGNVTMEAIELFNNGQIGNNFRDSAGTLTNDNFKSLSEGMNAFYLADLVVRDFGTHCINSIHAGAVLAKIDTLDTSSFNIKKEDRWKLGASASTSFANLFNFKLEGSTKSNTSIAENYESKITYSEILTYGGPIIHMSSVNLSYWEADLDNQLVAIDRSGQPIYEIITDRSLPELPGNMILRLTATLKSAVERYYKANTIVGCMNPLSAFYDNEANVASTECDIQNANKLNSTLYLGGVFQKCVGPDDLCISEIIANPLTGDLTCPHGYIPIQLLPQQVRRCYSICNEKTWFKTPECTTNCAITESFWCSRDPSSDLLDINDSGYLFGGLYTDKEVNSLTKQFNCPQHYWPIALGRRMRICLSSDRELAGKYSLPFGGFYSCYSGNPLISLISSSNQTGVNDNLARTALMSDWLRDQPQGRSSLTRNPQQQSQIGLATPPTSQGEEDISPFSGLFLQNENSQLFAALWPKRCPTGYTAHLASMEDICQVNYCVQANVLQEQRKRQLKRPPFVLPFSLDPHLFKLSDSNNFIGTSSDTVHDVNGNMIKKVNGRWEEPDQYNDNSYNYNNNGNSKRNQYAFAITLSTLLPINVILIIIISVILFYYTRQKTRLAAQ
ncbi:unnamed protein product [Trichobilharzia szidati]|nr:unnamed protein product [Trichobilharzia szidati]